MPSIRTYNPLLPKISAGDIFRGDPCGPRVPAPCPHTSGVRVCSCISIATEPCRPTACIPAAPFRHTPYCFRPRRTAAVWRNLPRHPRISETHTFSAKEKDSETGLSYFGARYYSSDLSIWLSVDPMSDKYASLSPYVYCANNPVKLVDPNGEETRKYEDYDTGETLGELDDGVDETVRVKKEDYFYIKDRYDYDVKNGDKNLSTYNAFLERNSIGKKGYDIAKTALSYKGSTQWAYSVKKDNFAADKNKCNKFIYDVLSESNAPASYSDRAPLAGEWANPTVVISNWDVVSGPPHVGDVIAGGHSFEDASGHVAIITHIFEYGYIETMSAGRTNVRIENFGNSVLKNKGKWGDVTYKPITIRRIKD